MEFLMPEPVLPPVNPAPVTGAGTTVALVVAWLWVGVPLVWGVVLTVKKSLVLFQ
jgi:hypothetical protein